MSPRKFVTDFRQHITGIRTHFSQYDPENIDPQAFTLLRHSILGFCDHLDQWADDICDLSTATDDAIEKLSAHRHDIHNSANAIVSLSVILVGSIILNVLLFVFWLIAI